MKRIFYKIVTRAADALGFRRLSSWAYGGWFRSWMDEDPIMGYWRFAEDYLGKRMA
jgi:hypothetical protein